MREWPVQSRYVAVNNINNNNGIYIAPYDRNFRGAGSLTHNLNTSQHHEGDTSSYNVVQHGATVTYRDPLQSRWRNQGRSQYWRSSSIPARAATERSHQFTFFTTLCIYSMKTTYATINKLSGWPRNVTDEDYQKVLEIEIWTADLKKT